LLRITLPNRKSAGNGSLLKNASETAQKEGVNFSSGERDMIIEVLKQSMPPQEQKKVDLLMQMMKNMKR